MRGARLAQCGTRRRCARRFQESGPPTPSSFFDTYTLTVSAVNMNLQEVHQTYWSREVVICRGRNHKRVQPEEDPINEGTREREPHSDRELHVSGFDRQPVAIQHLKGPAIHLLECVLAVTLRARWTS